MSITHNIFDASGGQEPDGPKPFLVEIEAPEGVFFISREGTLPDDYDYNRLGKLAARSDNGATLLTIVLEEIAIIEPLATIAKYQHDVAENNFQRENILSAYEGDAERLIPEDRHNFDDLLQEVVRLNERIDGWYAVQGRIDTAYRYYKSEFFNSSNGSSTRVDGQKIVELHDATADAEGSTVLVAIHNLRDNIPKPRVDARGQQTANTVEKTVVEAERIARILILDEMGKIDTLEN